MRMREFVAIAALLCVVTDVSWAQRRGGGGARGGGMRGGGGGGGFRGGGGGISRGASRPSVSRPSGGFNRPSTPSSIGSNRASNFGGSNLGRDINRGNIGSGNRDINRGDLNRANIDRDRINGGNDIINNRPINVGDNINIDGGGWGYGGWGSGCCYHPLAATAAIAGTAALTAAAIGSTVYTLPPACVSSIYSDLTYYNCDGTWYQPQFAGTTTTYVVVDPPGI